MFGRWRNTNRKTRSAKDGSGPETLEFDKANLFNKSIPLEDLKFLLEKNGLIYGLVDKDSLNNFIKNDLYLETPPRPILSISGKAVASTQIIGRYTRLILSHSLSRSRIMEMNTESGGKKGWEMVVTNI